MIKFEKKSVSSVLSTRLNLEFNNKEFSLGGWGQSDDYSKINNTWIFLEVEVKQKHPSTNVLKYWPYLESKSNENIVLIHAFSTESPGLNSSRGKLAEWVAQKMREEFGHRFKYYRIVFHDSENIIDGIDKLSMYIKSISK